jgi:hypothetical protein
MITGTAAGELLPPYVIYKSEGMWTSWVEGGPAGSRYNRTKSGWIDLTCFEDYFLWLLLPVLKKKPGRKVVISDNLSSHISVDVLKACKENNIAFISLPPNSTHLTQPLDVAYF